MATLNAKQKKFCDEYLIDMCRYKAAIRAGYSARSAASIANRLFEKRQVREEIDRLIAERSRRTGITQDRVLREIACVAFANAGDFIDMNTAEVLGGASEEDMRAVAGVKVKYVPHKSFDEEGNPQVDTAIEREVKLADKMRALDLLGRHLGMFTDRLDVTGDMDLNIKIDYGPADDEDDIDE